MEFKLKTLQEVGILPVSLGIERDVHSRYLLFFFSSFNVVLNPKSLNLIGYSGPDISMGFPSRPPFLLLKVSCIVNHLPFFYTSIDG